jgi:hypothetical protein
MSIRMTLQVAWIVSLTAAMSGAAPIPDLSGTWQADPAQSTSEKILKDAGPKAPIAPPAPPSGSAHPVERIEQHGSEVIINNLVDGELVSTLRLVTDGSEQVNHLAGGAVLHLSTTRWEGEKLLTDWRLERGGQAFSRGHDVRSLSTDGQRMILDRQVEDAKSRSTVHVVLERRPI